MRFTTLTSLVGAALAIMTRRRRSAWHSYISGPLGSRSKRLATSDRKGKL